MLRYETCPHDKDTAHLEEDERVAVVGLAIGALGTNAEAEAMRSVKTAADFMVLARV